MTTKFDQSKKTVKRIVNGLTFYRLLSAPVLLLLVFGNQVWLFKWLIVLSFLTDAIDGNLARRFKVTSTFGAQLDSAADKATVFVSAVAFFYFHQNFFVSHILPIALLSGLYFTQNFLAIAAYSKFTSFHTYMAKASAVLQALFFLHTFLSGDPSESLFYLASIITMIELVEEALLVFALPEWKSDVKGLYWIRRKGQVIH